ncbi:BON domain-containing protein [Nonomuraea sp. NPDC049480]|uniref:BON domain-containing protein n=1 Tax=Nonomuraea sp. NPDC049480 TaxID=3364353 RepID=UPI003787644F
MVTTMTHLPGAGPEVGWRKGRRTLSAARRDLLKAYVRDDAELKRWVENSIPEQARWNDRTGIVVQVQNGIVTLSGHTATRTEAAAAVTMAKGLGGVVDVRENLVWDRYDRFELPLLWDRS